MKTIEQEKDELDEKHQQNGLKEEQQQQSEKLSVSVSCTSGPQDSFEDSRKRRYYASFSFRFKSGASIDMSSFLSDGDQMRMDEFFDDEIILERKVEKRDVIFRPGCLSSKFMKQSSDLIYKFCQDANQKNFTELLEQVSCLEIPIFQAAQQNQSVYTINQALQDLFYRRQHTYFIYTFDWTFCHLSFVCCLLIYWIQIQIGTAVEETPNLNKVKQQFINKQKIKLKQNMCFIALLYSEERSQQINTNQPVLLVLYQFLNYLKRQPCLNIVQISKIQDKLINDIKLFRRIRRKQKQFSSPNNEMIIQSQLRKYQHENKLITSFQKTQNLLFLICSHNFVSCPLLKYYQLDQYKDSRRNYQLKKDYFCLWVLNIILNESQRKAIDSLHNAALYIMIFMTILKKMTKQSNIEGISYLVPILANIKMHIPKVWKHVKQRIPQIQKKLNEYTKKLTKKQFKTGQLLNGNTILWKQTIFEMTLKMDKYLTSHQYVQLNQHKKFYEEFLIHFLHYRRNVQKQYKDQIEKYDKQKEIGTSFNMYLLDTYIPKLYEDKNFDEEWKKFIRRAERVNKNISASIYDNFVNYCFVGSTFTFKKIQI